MAVNDPYKVDEETGSEGVSTTASENDVVLSVEGVSKKFCRSLKRSLYYGLRDITGEVLGRSGQHRNLRKGEFWALKDISFELKKGEALGLVGANGSGKTTLLRIIAGLIKPDAGKVTVRGRVAPLLAAGVGFNPILTGRENIYVNMSVLGLSKQEIDDRFEDVVAFAEIEEAIDAPVQTYSSGMQARLGFACAIHVEPEIVLMDEVLSVGDIEFRAKCYQKLAALRRKNISFIMVSHNPQSILQVCDFSVYLLRGNLIFTGASEEAISKYEKDLFSFKDSREQGKQLSPLRTRKNDSGIEIKSVYFTNYLGDPIDRLESGQEVTLKLHCEADKDFTSLNAYIKISQLNREGGDVLFLATDLDKTYFKIEKGNHSINLHFPFLGLAPGSYSMSIKLKNGTIETVDFIRDFKFSVDADSRMYKCRYFQPREWASESSH